MAQSQVTKTPPWLNDSHPHWWHPAPIAAVQYFKKSPRRIRQMAADGTLTEAGIAVYFDGTRWYVRVPLQYVRSRAKRVKWVKPAPF